MMKKLLSVLLLLAMCFTFLVACDTELPDIQVEIEDEDDEPKGGSHYKPKVETEPNDEGADLPANPPAEEEEPDPERVEIPEMDLGGYHYVIWNDSWGEDFEIAAPTALNGVSLNDTIYRRNKAVEQALNIAIIEAGNPNVSTSDALSFLNNMHVSGDYFADLYSFDANVMISSLATNGLFVDLAGSDLSGEWWDQNFLEETTINGTFYTFTGWIQTNDDLHTNVLALNHTLFMSLYEDDIYELVMDGNWTLEAFRGYWQNVGQNLGSAGLDGGDRVGLAYDAATGSYLMVGSDIRTFYMEKSDPVLTDLTSNKVLNVVDFLQRLAKGNDNFDTGLALGTVSGNAMYDYDMAKAHFQSGNVLFKTANIFETLGWYNVMQDDVYYLPFPKYDAEQETYHNLVQFGFEPFALSENVGNLERTALITEVLGAVSAMLNEELEELVLQNHLLDEVAPRELLRLALDTKDYDMDYMAGATSFSGKINQMLAQCDFSTYTSVAAQIESTSINIRGTGTLQIFIKRYTQKPIR